jgi:lipid A 3-O-deacylase
MKSLLTLLLCFFLKQMDAQTDVLPQRLHSWRIGTDNDAYVLRQKTDRYYTFGLSIDYFFSKNGLNKPFWNKIFPHISQNADQYYAMNFRTATYTSDTAWQISTRLDHPYGGRMTIGMTCISKQPETGRQLTTEYQLGVIGPAAQQAWLQRTAHRLMHISYPVGWEQQIPNDIVLNARLTYENPVWSVANRVEGTVIADLHVGTVMNQAGIGFRWKMGNFYSIRQLGLPFLDAHLDKKINYFMAVQPSIYLVGYNAMLQGGLFLDAARRNQYMSAENMNHLVSDVVLSYHLSYSNLGFTYLYRVRSPEFKGGKEMFLGSLNFQARF